MQSLLGSHLFEVCSQRCAIASFQGRKVCLAVISLENRGNEVPLWYGSPTLNTEQDLRLKILQTLTYNAEIW